MNTLKACDKITLTKSRPDYGHPLGNLACESGAGQVETRVMVGDKAWFGYVYIFRRDLIFKLRRG
jgi:PIN domain nuclease of toxin-antitoxin system